MILIDRLAVEYIHKSSWTGGIMEYLIAVFSLTFNNEIIFFGYNLALLSAPWSIKNWVLCAILAPTGLGITFVLKKVISRPRPFIYPQRSKSLIFDFRGAEKNHSMPSGDSIQSSIFWTMLWHFNVVPLWISFVMAGMTMLGRIYYMCHYPTDTIAGALIGISIFFLTHTLIDRL
jgi:membrane-associated phospholipid phosphatase